MIGFCSDFGYRDPYVGICHAVIARIAPDVRVIDLDHGIPPGDIRRGAAVLAQAVPYLPAPAVVLAVVDPGVGTDRAGLVVRAAGGTVLVGPDNGLLCWAADPLGGPVAAHAITNDALLLDPVSRTFHGRDVFAPVAARLARGLDPAEVGPPLPVDALVRLPDPVVRVSPGVLAAEVLTVDRYGNLQTAARVADLGAALGVALGSGASCRVSLDARSLPAAVGLTYGSVPAGAAVVYADSAGQVAVAINGGRAAEALGADAGDVIEIA